MDANLVIPLMSSHKAAANDTYSSPRGWRPGLV